MVDDGINGLLVAPRNAMELAEAIERLIHDDALRYRMGEASRRKAIEEFDVRKVVAQYMPLYEEKPRVP